MKRHQPVVTWKDWCSGSMSDGRRCVAQPFRILNGRFAHGELYGKEFKDKASAAMLARGYSQIYYHRSSVVCPLFSDLAFMRQRARFDALYRLWKWKKKHGKSRVRLEKQLTELAEKVGIFHPCTKQFRP